MLALAWLLIASVIWLLFLPIKYLLLYFGYIQRKPARLAELTRAGHGAAILALILYTWFGTSINAHYPFLFLVDLGLAVFAVLYIATGYRQAQGPMDPRIMGSSVVQGTIGLSVLFVARPQFSGWESIRYWTGYPIWFFNGHQGVVAYQWAVFIADYEMMALKVIAIWNLACGGTKILVLAKWARPVDLDRERRKLAQQGPYGTARPLTSDEVADILSSKKPEPGQPERGQKTKASRSFMDRILYGEKPWP
jgi:hypothetical protein